MQALYVRPDAVCSGTLVDYGRLYGSGGGCSRIFVSSTAKDNFEGQFFFPPVLILNSPEFVAAKRFID